MTRSRLRLLAASLALPLAGLALLLLRPSADGRWEHQPSHFWLVLVTAGVNAALAYATGIAARRRGDRRVHLVSLAFLAASGFLATPIGLALAGAFAAISSLERDVVPPSVLEGLLLALLAIWAVVSLTLLPELETLSVPGRLSLPLVLLGVVGVALYVFAAARYVTLYRKRRSALLLGFTVAFVLLSEAMVAVALGRSWQISWWEWHVLMLVAFGLIALTAHREWHIERFRGLYRDETAEATRPVTVLFADLQGFTTFSESHGASEVSEMLNALFEAAIPAIEMQGGEIDRLLGDAVMATFNRRGDQGDHSAPGGAAPTASSGTPSTSPRASRGSPRRAASRSARGPRNDSRGPGRSSSASSRSRAGERR